MSDCVDCTKCLGYDEQGRFSPVLKPGGGLTIHDGGFMLVDSSTPAIPLNSLPADEKVPGKQGLFQDSSGLMWATPRAKIQEISVDFTQVFGGTISGTHDNVNFINESLPGNECLPTVYHLAVSRTADLNSQTGRTEFHFVEYINGGVYSQNITGFRMEESTRWIHTWTDMITVVVPANTTGNITMGFQVATASADVIIETMRYGIKGVGVSIPLCS